MKKDNVIFQSSPWPVAEVTIFKGTPEEADVLVATTDLEDRLLADMDSKEAMNLDRLIGYYVRPGEIALPCDDIVRIVEAGYS